VKDVTRFRRVSSQSVFYVRYVRSGVMGIWLEGSNDYEGVGERRGLNCNQCRVSSIEGCVCLRVT
jgi:hypothetical protein